MAVGDRLPQTDKRRRRKTSGSVTLKDVAEAAGVGTTTVSRVIRNVGPISVATRKSVEDAIDRLGYAPNLVAGSLASVDSGLIGVVIPATRVLIFIELLQGIQAALKDTRYMAVVTESGYDLASEERAIRSLLGWRPAAMIVTGCDHTPAARALLRNYTGRVIEVMDIEGEPIDTAVGLSFRKAGRLCAEHLIGRGYRRFAYIGHNFETDLRNKQRFLAMSECLGEHGLSFVTTWFSGGLSSAAMGRQATEQIRTAHPDVDVIVYANDTLAMGGSFYCMSAGLKMPEDLAIFGFNAVDFAQELPIPLSTVDAHMNKMGFSAIEEALRSTTRPARRKKIDTGVDLIAGGSA